MMSAAVAPPDNSPLYKSAEGYRAVLAHYDKSLQLMRVPYESKFVETHLGPTHAVISGNQARKPVVLWHGQNASVVTWVRWIPVLAQIYQVYAIDVVGGMGKSAPSRPSKKGAAYGEWAVEVLQALGLEGASHVGASQGAWLIGKLAAVAPNMISSAVLMSPAGLSRLSMRQVFRMLPRILFKPPAAAAREMLAMVSGPDAPPDPVFLGLFELMICHFRSEPIVPLLGVAELKRLTAPTYLLMGQYESTMNPYEAIQRGLGQLPNVVAAEIVPGVGHSMTHRQPDWVTARVMRFLDSYAR